MAKDWDTFKVQGQGTGNGERVRGTGIGNWDGEQEWVITGKEMTAAVIGDG